MNLPLQINDNLVIPADQIHISAVRSSGPGGQNVNKVATCIELRFNPKNCNLLKPAVVERLLFAARNRLDADGNIIVTSQKYREQYRNLIDAYDKLKAMIQKALRPPKIRKPTAPSKAAKEKRVTKKKLHGAKKAIRRKPIILDDD
ncbi:MAG: alternative ribosome rescue aminoacyl-tRNA hydrolase ArfB [Candidatus Rifleibacteriota bacterium]